MSYDQIPYILSHYLLPDREEGGSIEKFVGMFSSKYSAQDIRQKFNYLATEGVIFSTMDDDHYSII